MRQKALSSSSPPPPVAAFFLNSHTPFRLLSLSFLPQPPPNSQLPLRRRPRRGRHPRLGQQKVPPLARLRRHRLVGPLPRRAALARGLRQRGDLEGRHGRLARRVARADGGDGPAVPRDREELPGTVGRWPLGLHGALLRVVPVAAGGQGREGQEGGGEEKGRCCCCPRGIPCQEGDEGCCCFEEARVKNNKG